MGSWSARSHGPRSRGAGPITAQEKELQTLRREIEGLRIEAATLAERAAHTDELRTVLKTFQEQKGRGGSTGRAKAAPQEVREL